MSYSQRDLIKKYFNLLFEEFIKDQKHRNVEIIFQDFSDSRIQGQTRRNKTKKVSQKGKIVSKKYTYTIQFLARNYENEEDLQSTVVHEFTHLYLFSTIGKHEHGSSFYSKMYYFEDWLNENQALTPRSEESKKHDKDQEIDIHKELEDLEKRLIKSKKKKRKLKEKLEEEKSKCDQCNGQLGNSYFYNKKANDNKKMCSDECYSLYYAETCDKCSKKITTSEKSYYADAKNKIGVLCEHCWGTKKGSENSPTIPGNNPKPDPGWKYCSVCLACNQRWNYTKKPRKWC